MFSFMDLIEILARRADAHARDAAAIRAQAQAVRERMAASEAIATWMEREADALGSDPEAALLHRRVEVIRIEIATMAREAVRYDVEANRADAQAEKVADQVETLEQSRRNAFVHH